MECFVALLRAINVGGRVVKMERLRTIIEAAGFENVETLIASGNVIFESAETNQELIEGELEAALEKSLGYPVATFVRSRAEIAAIAARQPFRHVPNGSTLYLAFARAAIERTTISDLLARQTATDRFRVLGREIYWLCLTRFSDSTFSGPRLEKVLGQQVTARNANTIGKLAVRAELR